MKTQLTKLEVLESNNTHLNNIILINNTDDSGIIDEDLMDFDFDFDPNEMYFALLKND